MVAFINELLRTLFWIGLLPARFKEKNVRFDVRESCLFGLSSRFVKLDPAFVRYLEKKNVKYRLKRTLDYSPTICFWSRRDHKIYVDATDRDLTFIAPARFYIELLELGIDHTRRPAGGGGYWYNVFCPVRMVELMLRFDSKKEHGYREFFLGTVTNG